MPLLFPPTIQHRTARITRIIPARDSLMGCNPIAVTCSLRRGAVSETAKKVLTNEVSVLEHDAPLVLRAASDLDSQY
jgi:hypothetical protein